MPHNYSDQSATELPPSDSTPEQTTIKIHSTETPPATILDSMPNCVPGYAHYLYKELQNTKSTVGDGCRLISQIIDASKIKWHTTIYEQAFYSASKLQMHDVMSYICKAYPPIMDSYWAIAAARWAIQQHNIDELEHLLSLGINPSFELPCNQSLIKIAFQYDDGDAAKLLMAAGADLSNLSVSQLDDLSTLCPTSETTTPPSLLGTICSCFTNCFGLFEDA